MVQGNVEIAALAGKELSYIPYGQDKHYPFRTTSAVVTELSPLLLLLEHQKDMVGLFYEEPEMCLHPAYQCTLPCIHVLQSAIQRELLTQQVLLRL